MTPPLPGLPIFLGHLATDPRIASARWARGDAAQNDPKLHLGS